MSISATVLINAAGRGSRLGLGINKALVEIAGASIIEWQLRLLPKSVSVIVGVGYQAEEVRSRVLGIRKDIQFSVNPNFGETGTAATLVRSAQMATGRIVSLDADLIVEPMDLLSFIYSDCDLVGVCNPSSMEPVLANINDKDGHMIVEKFLREAKDNHQQMEWTGLLNCMAEGISDSPLSGHVFELIADKLPIKALEIRAKELDFKEELPVFEAWVRELRDKYL